MSSLIKYEAACQALAECVSVDEVKEWADKAAAMQAYQRMAGDKTLESQASEIRIRAERRLGELILAQKAGPGLNQGAKVAGNLPGAGKAQPAVTHEDRRLKLSDAGISKNLSSRAQKLAAVPAAEFEAELAAKRERERQDGARVSARLEKSGARHLEKVAPVADHDPDLESPAEMMADMQKELDALNAVLKAADADDQKAEALKWRRAYDAAVRGQSEAMDRAHKSVEREKVTKRQLMRCGKAVGEDDEFKIAPAVEAMARAYKADRIGRAAA